MTIEITIPIFETFWSLNGYMRIIIIFGLCGLILFGADHFIFNTTTHITVMGGMCMVIVLIAFLLWGSEGIYSTLPPINFTFPVSIKIT